MKYWVCNEGRDDLEKLKITLMIFKIAVKKLIFYFQNK